MHADGTGLRFAVLGNCQAGGLLDCILACLPGAEGERFDLTPLRRAAEPAGEAEAIAARLGDFTHVVAHRLKGEQFGPLQGDRLAERPNVTMVPAIAFEGFHPDCLYLRPPGRRLMGPMDEYHSAICAAAFLDGLPVERTARLYNRLVLHRIGFLDFHATAREMLARHFAEHGLDLDAFWDGWMARGAFMHSINHPKLFALADLARAVLARLGLGDFPAEATGIVVDRLAEGPAWPVYPPIARQFGWAGSLVFRGVAARTRPLAPMTLETFLRRSYEAYAADPAAVEAAVAESGRAQRVRRVLARLPEHAR